LPFGSTPQNITGGPDGNVWYTDWGGNRIGRITPGGSITTFPISPPGTPSTQPWGITAGPDGNLWFTENLGNKIGRITPNGVVTEFALPNLVDDPGPITAGPDGNLWFAGITTNKIGRITTDGVITMFGIPSISTIYSITPGYDGNVYFAEQFANKIGQITPNGTVTEFTVPTSFSLPYGVVGAPDGHVYFTEQSGLKLGDLDPITGTIVETALPTGTNQYDGFSQPQNIVVGPDNNLWFNDEVNNVIGKATIRYDIRLAITPPTGTLEGAPLTNATVATFTDANPVPVDQYTVTIDWGDGTTSPGTVVATSNGFAVQGSTTYQNAGTYPLRVSVSRAGGARAFGTASITISPIPLVANGVTLTGLQEGVPLSPTTPLATFTDPRAAIQAPGNYTVSIDWGDGTPPTSGTVVPTASPNQFIVTSPHAFPGGTSLVTITITGANGATATTTSTVTTIDSELTPGAVPIEIQQVEGIPFSGLVAQFSDADPRQPGIDYYSATIDWGDGTTSDGVIVNDPNGGYGVNGSHVYRVGSSPVPITYQIVVRIKDKDVSTTTATATAEISNAPILQRSVSFRTIEGQTFTGVVGAFTDENDQARGEDYRALIDWGDGTPQTTGRVSYEGDHQFTIVGSHAYAAGTYPITVHIIEPAAPTNNLDITGGTATVASTPISAAPAAAFNGVEGVPVTALLATFHDANPRSQASDYTATIDWGDGTTSPGVISTDPLGGYLVNGSHTFDKQGTYPVGVTIKAKSGNLTRVATSARVGDAPLTAQGTTISATELTPFVAVVGTFTDANPNGKASEFTATINWGDGVVSTGVVSAKLGGGFAVTGSHVYNQGGSYVVNVSIASNGTSRARATSTAIVADKLYPVTGTLNPFTDTGLSPFDGITRLNQTNFLGSAQPGAVVTLYAVPAFTFQTVPIGSGVADAQGHWNIAPSPLLDGSYTMFASAVDADGRPSSPLTPLMTHPLVIDTIGPRVASTLLNPRTGQITANFQDVGGGMDPLALGNGLNYTLAAVTRRGTQPLPLTSLSVSPSGSPLQTTVNAGFGRGPLARGTYVLTMTSSGLTDLAGNALVESTYVSFPPSSNQFGSNYVAQFSTDGRTPTGPTQYVPPGQISGANRFRDFLRDRLLNGRRLRARQLGL
jgi:streptogramin lyase